jgi:hypothetical protein
MQEAETAADIHRTRGSSFGFFIEKNCRAAAWIERAAP